jgi:hypothetical protein
LDSRLQCGPPGALGEDAVILPALISLEAADCRAAGGRGTADGPQRRGGRSQFGAGLISNGLIVWRGFLQNVICSEHTSLNSGRREYLFVVSK